MEKIGYKIREAQLQKVPYMLVIGDREAAEGTVSVRSRSAGDLGARPLADFVSDGARTKSTRKALAPRACGRRDGVGNRPERSSGGRSPTSEPEPDREDSYRFRSFAPT